MFHPIAMLGFNTHPFMISRVWAKAMEPGALVALAGICAGGTSKGWLYRDPLIALSKKAAPG